jgi:uncharacterized protein (TIRG00374 family)
MPVHLKKLLLTLGKFGISAALLGYVVVKAQQDASFAQLRDQPKHWGLLLLACLLLLTSAMISFYRWYLLVRALDLPFRIRDALRLGFLGYLLNFVSLGSVGGDLFKAVFMAREQHGHRTEAVATVIIDRLLGLYCLLLVGTLGVLFVDLPASVKPIGDGTLTCTAIGTVCILLLMVPAVTGSAIERRAESAPIVGGLLRRLVCAIRMYRNKYTVLVLSLLLGMLIHGVTVLSLFCVACGLPGEHPTLAQHFVIVPLGMLTGILPLPLGALGAVENVMDYLYFQIAESNMGVIVTFGYRANTILVAMIGAGYYLGSRREFSAAMHEAEAEQEEENAEQASKVADGNPAIGQESAV